MKQGITLSSLWLPPSHLTNELRGEVSSCVVVNIDIRLLVISLEYKYRAHANETQHSNFSLMWKYYRHNNCNTYFIIYTH